MIAAPSRGPLRLTLGLLAALTLGHPAPAQDVTVAAPQEAGDTASARAPAPRLGHSGLPLPRFVSLRAREVNMRTGPGIRYPIDWVYRRPKLPLEVIDEFEHWRRVRDWEGSVGWVHKSMLSSERSVIVTGAGAVLRRASRADAPAVARLEGGVIGALEQCAADWCQVRVEGFDGWLPAAVVFGTAR